MRGGGALHTDAVSVALTVRQKAALRAYADAVGCSMGAYVRALVVDAIPPEFWAPLAPPAGQMTLGEGEE